MPPHSAGPPAADGFDPELTAPLRPVLETALDAVIVMCADGLIADWNGCAEEIFGWSRDEAVGRPLAELIIPPRYREAHHRGLAKVLRAGHDAATARRMEVSALRRDGREFPVELAITSMRAGDAILFIGFLRDITDRKQAERRLRRQVTEAELLYRATATAAETDAFEDALRACLAAICRMTGWPMGHAYAPSGREPRVLVSTTVWHLDDPGRFAILRAITEATDLPPGVGLPGRIWETGEPLWVADVRSDPVFVRAGPARDIGITSAFGFPIRSGGAIVAILEFFSDAPAELDPDLLLMVRTIGEQVGRVFERKRAAEAFRDQARTLETINRINLSLAAELNLERLVQAVTDAATDVTGAEFGAFFYNIVREDGEAYTLYTLSGTPREAFSKFPMPRNTAVFHPTFAGESVLRLDDVTQDPRYGRNPPYNGMPDGHLPVRSYLAVPVVARSGEVLGGLFFGHSQPGMFTQRHESIVAAIAVQAAIGIDNARLYRRAENDIAERKRAEAQQALLLAELNHRVKNTLAVVMGIAAQTARTSPSVEAFSEAFLGRLHALGRAHSLLTAGNWDVTPLRALVEEALAPYRAPDGDAVAVGGPDLPLKPKAALAMSMILHELTTNAVKYGALAAPEGRIAVEWTLTGADGAQTVDLRWRESGLAGLRPPTRRGFGSTMIEASTRHELGGRADVLFREDGLQFDIHFPWDG